MSPEIALPDLFVDRLLDRLKGIFVDISIDRGLFFRLILDTRVLKLP
jgi:hypothetical protein